VWFDRLTTNGRSPSFLKFNIVEVNISEQNMPAETLYKLRERIQNLLVQGLRVSSPDELGVLAQKLLELNLTQPATLLNHIQQNVADRKTEKKDVESLIKVLQILSQAEIHLIEAESVEVANLTQVQGFTALYVDTDEITQADQADLHAIMRIPNPFVRGQRMIEYVKHASYEELVRSIEIAWFDYSLSSAIVEGLRARPAEACKLAQMAFGYKSLVMQNTAIRVLEQLSPGNAGVSSALNVDKMSAPPGAGETPVFPGTYMQQVLNVLQKQLNKAKEPVKYRIEEAIAKVEGRNEEYIKARQTRFNVHTDHVKNLTSPKRSDRVKALKALAKTKDPCFTQVLIRAIENPDWQVPLDAPVVLVKIGGVEAIPKLVSLLKTDFQHFAAQALYQLGDRRGLEYFLRRRLSSALESYVPFSEYGSLIVHPLLSLVKTLDKPEQYKEGFFSLFNLFRSKEFAQKIMEYLEQDAELAEKFVAILARTHPGQYEKFLGNRDQVLYPGVAVRRELVAATLGENPNKLITRLKSNYLVQDLALTPDGKYLLTMNVYGEVAVWKTDAWKKDSSFTLKCKKYSYFLHQIALTPDGKYVVTPNTCDNAIELLEFGTWERCFVALKLGAEVHAVGVTADGKYILGGGEDSIKAWEFGTWRKVAELGGHSGGIKVIKAIPGKNWMVTGDCNGVIHVWDQATWQKIADLKVNSLAQNTVVVSHDGHYVIAIETPASYLETKVKVWETMTWKAVAYLTIPSPVPITCLAFTPDNRYVIAAASGTMKFLEVGSWREILTMSSSDDVRTVTVTPDGKYVIAGLNVWQVDWSF
jgi:WD40 repeat protein